jgi:hypothetical protein
MLSIIQAAHTEKDKLLGKKEQSSGLTDLIKNEQCAQKLVQMCMLSWLACALLYLDWPSIIKFNRIDTDDYRAREKVSAAPSKFAATLLLSWMRLSRSYSTCTSRAMLSTSCCCVGGDDVL